MNSAGTVWAAPLQEFYHAQRKSGTESHRVLTYHNDNTARVPTPTKPF